MGQLIADLVPLALGVVLSPLAIVALVAVLVSQRGRINGVAYLLGWLLGLAGLMVAFRAVFAAGAVHSEHAPPVWVSLLQLLLGVGLVVAGVFIYRRGHHQLLEMEKARGFGDVVVAAPQLPGYLASVEHFRAGRTFLLGTGLFVLNPVDASCTILGALAIATANVPPATADAAAVGFVVIGALPIAIPVCYVVARGADARPLLDKVRGWIASNTHVLNAGLLLMIGAMQIQNAIKALIAAAQ